MQSNNAILCEIENVRATDILLESSSYSVFISEACNIENILIEIGRLREKTFRMIGITQGKEIDLDDFDSYYQHLFLWSKKAQEIVGAYRIGKVDEIVNQFGLAGLSSSRLFSYKPNFFQKIPPAIELGRAFIRKEYQKKVAPLTLLWNGIAVFISKNPRYRVLFGSVSIDNLYQPESKRMMVKFLKRKSEMTHLSRQVHPKFKLPTSFSRSPPIHEFNALEQRIKTIENGARGTPLLLRKYLGLNGHVVQFSLDYDFGGLLDCLLFLDLLQVDRKYLIRFIGKKRAEEYVSYHARIDMPARASI